MKRLVKIFKWLLFSTLFLLLGVSLLFYIKRNDIIALVVNEASKQLTAPVDVKEVQISFSKFPAAAIHLDEVFTAGNPAVGGDTLLYAKSVYLQFDFWRIITGNITIDRISVEDGTLHIIRDKQNRYNYEIWQEINEETDSELFAINRLVLQNIKTVYHDLPEEIMVRGKIMVADGEGDFSSQLDINTHLLAQLEKIHLEGQAYLQEKTELESDLKVQYMDGHFALTSDLVSVNGNSQFALDYTYKDGQSKLLAWMSNQEIEPLWDFAQQQGFIDSSNYRFSGGLNAELTMLNGSEEKLSLSFNSDDFDASVPGYFSMNGLKLDGIYEATPHSDRLEINELSLDEGEDFMSLRAKLFDLSHPRVEAYVKANLPVSDWLELLPLDTLENGQGRASLDFAFEGSFTSLNDITARELSHARLNGDLVLEEAGFTFGKTGREINRISGELAMENTNLLIERLFFSSGQSDIYLQGRFENVLNFMFFEGEKLVVKSMVKSQEIVLDDFIRDEQSSEESYKLEITENLDLRLQLEVDRLSFGNFRARKLKGNLQITGGEIVGSDIGLQADGGRYKGNFLVSPYRDSLYLVRATLEADDIQMNSVFKSFNNFNQQAITAQNLQGQATIQANLGAEMSKALVIDPASIDLVASVEIKNGHLKNYEPLKALSRFAELKELEDVAFSKLANTITIHNSEISIPEMAINSNVLNLELSGTHDFDNNIDYIIRLKLGDILFAKRKQKNTGGEFDEHLAIADRGDDHIIPVAIKGTVDEPEISLSRKGFAESINEDLKKQGQQLKDLFKKDKKPEKQSGNGIIYEWDEG